MSNLSGVQFQSKDWNPFVGAANMIDKLIPKSKDKTEYKGYSQATDMQSHTETTTLKQQTKPTKQEKPTPSNTGAPYPGYRKQGPITPATTGAPMPGTLKTKTSTHPITGEKVTPMPVKRKGAKPTAPGTRPKPPKKR